MDGSEFFKPEFIYAIITGSFPICFLNVTLSESRCMLPSGLLPVLTILFYTFGSFSLGQSNNKSPKVYMTLLSIPAVVWMVSTSPIISNSSNPFTNPLVTLPRAPVTIGIIVTFMFHCVFFLILSQG